MKLELGLKVPIPIRLEVDGYDKDCYPPTGPVQPQQKHALELILVASTGQDSSLKMQCTRCKKHWTVMHWRSHG